MPLLISDLCAAYRPSTAELKQFCHKESEAYLESREKNGTSYDEIWRVDGYITRYEVFRRGDSWRITRLRGDLPNFRRQHYIPPHEKDRYCPHVGGEELLSVFDFGSLEHALEQIALYEAEDQFLRHVEDIERELNIPQWAEEVGSSNPPPIPRLDYQTRMLIATNLAIANAQAESQTSNLKAK